MYTVTGRLVNAGVRRRKRKSKTAECKHCEHEALCEGFWKWEAKPPINS